MVGLISILVFFRDLAVFHVLTKPQSCCQHRSPATGRSDCFHFTTVKVRAAVPPGPFTNVRAVGAVPAILIPVTCPELAVNAVTDIVSDIERLVLCSALSKSYQC